jgi:hypothetical protein
MMLQIRELANPEQFDAALARKFAKFCRKMSAARDGSRSQPEKGEVYHYYKGIECCVVAVAQDPEGVTYVVYLEQKYSLLLAFETTSFLAKNEATGRTMLVEEKAGLTTIQFTTSDIEPIALARPLDDFMAVVGGDEGTNFYRFERR